jgi:hypothetical protein
VKITPGIVRSFDPFLPFESAGKIAEGLERKLQQEEVRRERRASGRPRRPTIDREVLGDWAVVLDLVNEYRRFEVSRLPQPAAPPFAIEGFDAFCGRLLLDWDPAASTSMTLAETRDFYRQWWWALLIGALWASYAANGGRAAGISGRTADKLKGLADQFVSYWSRPTSLDSLGAELRPAAAFTMDLIARTPDAARRVRRCDYSRCEAYHLDASPTYRTNPARGCRRSHTTMAARQEAPRKPARRR